MHIKNFFRDRFISLKDDIIHWYKSLTWKRAIIYFLTIIIASLFIFYGTTIDYTVDTGQRDLNQSSFHSEYTKVKVIKIVDDWEIWGNDILNNADCITEKGVVYYCKILDGELKGQYTYVVHTIVDVQSTYLYYASIGSKIYCRDITIGSSLLNNVDDEYKDLITMSFSSSDTTFDHTTTLIWLLVIFLFLIIAFSKSKGISTILSLFFAVSSIIFVYIPAVLSGKNIYLWTIIICVFSICVTLLLVEGITKKSIATACGCFCGVAVSGILCVITNRTMNIIGIGEYNDPQMILVQTYYYVFDCIKTLNLRGLIFSAVTIGSLGAIMDVAMSLSSSLLEVYENSTEHSLKKTMKSGITIGRDMLGTMSNTLVLAYVSTSLAQILFYVANYYPELILRKEMFVVPAIQSLIGSIGILITIPFTSLICGLLYNNVKIRKKELISTTE